MRLRCRDCGTESYSAVAELLLQEGISCERCDGRLRLVERRESLPSGGRQSRFSRSLLKDEGDGDIQTGACESSSRAP